MRVSRQAFENVTERCDQLLQIFFDLTTAKNFNIDNLLLRESMDVIGECPVFICSNLPRCILHSQYLSISYKLDLP